MTRPSEDDLIARYFRPLATDPGALRLGDDCATLTPQAGYELVLKTDAVAEGIHFFSDDSWKFVAQKALRVNLSDLAAKGARPLGYLLSLALPSDWTEPHLADFAAGLAEDQATYAISLLGGDTIRSPKGLVITITVIGAVPTGRMARRAGAREGDQIFVSGTIGDSALGLKLRLDHALAAKLDLDAMAQSYLLERYLLPQPRSVLAGAVLDHANGAMDVSDGLVLDLTRMARVSGVDAELEIDKVPLSAAARLALTRDPSLLSTLVTGGDDYELLLTVPAARSDAFADAANCAGVVVTRIGTIVPGNGNLRLLGKTGDLLEIRATGYSHF